MIILLVILVENSKFFCVLVCHFFLKILLLWLVNPRMLHLKWCHTLQLYQSSSEKWSIYYALLSAMFNPLHSILNQELFKKHLYNPCIPIERNGAARPSYINYMKSEVSIMLHCQLCSTHYTAVWIKTVWKAPLQSKQPLLKIRMISVTKGSHHVLSPNRHFLLSAKMNGTQRRTLVSPWRMHCTYCGMPKGTSQAEAIVEQWKTIKPVALAIIELCLSKASVSQSVELVSG